MLVQTARQPPGHLLVLQIHRIGLFAQQVLGELCTVQRYQRILVLVVLDDALHHTGGVVKLPPSSCLMQHRDARANLRPLVREAFFVCLIFFVIRRVIKIDAPKCPRMLIFLFTNMIQKEVENFSLLVQVLNTTFLLWISHI